MRLEKDGSALKFATPAGAKLFDYNLKPPTGTKLSVASGCFFHPLYTPSGRAATDLAPADHPHHRGVFLAFVEMHGKHDADFWGWGQYAPKENRIVENVEVEFDEKRPGHVALKNAWKVDGAVVVDETLTTTLVEATAAANVIDLAYTLTPREDVRLARWAFSGFCVRLRKEASGEAKIVYTSPSGVEQRADVNHMKPEQNWPAADWYDATVTAAPAKSSEGGASSAAPSELGVAVIDHPANPKCTWHNERHIFMLNPCIVAPGELKLAAGKLLVMKYRLVVHDGPAPVDAIKQQAAAFRNAKVQKD